MKIIQKKVLFFVIVTILVLSLGIYLLFFSNAKTTQTGYQDIELSGSSPMRTGEFDMLKTRNGNEEGGRIVISVREPGIGKKRLILHVDITMQTDENVKIASADIKEGETKYLENTGVAGEYYDIVFSNPYGDDEANDGLGADYDYGVKVMMDEVKNENLPRPYVG